MDSDVSWEFMGITYSMVKQRPRSSPVEMRVIHSEALLELSVLKQDFQKLPGSLTCSIFVLRLDINHRKSKDRKYLAASLSHCPRNDTEKTQIRSFLMVALAGALQHR